MQHELVPEEFGGDTMFASMTAAYATLSERMQQYLAGTTALHGFGRFGAMLRQDPERRHLLHRVENELPMPHHPVVRVHPETGRKALFVTAVGVDANEAADLVREMHGDHRIPTLLKRVDALCREPPG